MTTRLGDAVALHQQGRLPEAAAGLFGGVIAAGRMPARCLTRGPHPGVAVIAKGRHISALRP